jgi:hypothetical protein
MNRTYLDPIQHAQQDIYWRPAIRGIMCSDGHGQLSVCPGPVTPCTCPLEAVQVCQFLARPVCPATQSVCPRVRMAARRSGPHTHLSVCPVQVAGYKVKCMLAAPKGNRGRTDSGSTELVSPSHSVRSH